MQKTPRHLLGLVAAFAIATSSFVASALYADTQLATIAHRSHQVSDNAMPSLFRLGVMRRECTEILFLLDEACKGRPALFEELPAHWAHVDEARRAYELLPWWAGEHDLWIDTAGALDRARASARTVESLSAGGRTREAEKVEVEDFDPTMRGIDGNLQQLLRMNRTEGERVATEADDLWRRERRTSLALCAVSVALTAALAVNAFRNARRYESLQRQRAEELDAFAGRVAHDIRGPLVPARLAIQSVERSLDAGDKRRKTLERGGRCLVHLEALVADLLTFARASGPPDRDASAQLREVVSEVVHDLEPRAEECGIQIAVEDLPECALACAPGVLTSIVLNLVDNSLKHMMPTATGRVVLRGNREGRRVHVEVADTGRGLPPGDPSRLFHPYVRADAAKPGLGLGLATVRRLVEAHGGIVGARPNNGPGAVFWFDMPATRPV
jgi:signal transduction histidine kinase